MTKTLHCVVLVYLAASSCGSCSTGQLEQSQRVIERTQGAFDVVAPAVNTATGGAASPALTVIGVALTAVGAAVSVLLKRRQRAAPTEGQR